LIFSKFFAAGYYSSSLMTLLFLSGILIIFLKKLRLYPMVIWFLIYYMALIFSRTSIHGWYLIPPLFVYTTIAGITIIFIFITIQKKIKRNKILLKILILIGILFFSSITLYQKIIQIKKEYLYEKIVRERIGRFINNNTPKNSSIFLEPIGVIGYYSDRYIYDDAALISPMFLEFNKLPYNAESRYKKIQFVRPDYLVLRNKYLKEFYLKTNLLEDYITIKNFDFYIDPNHPEFLAMTVFERKKS